MHTFQVQSSISQFQPLLGELSGSSGALDTSFSLPVIWGGVPESTGTVSYSPVLRLPVI